MIFKPSKTTGLAIGLAAAVVLAGLAAGALAYLRAAPFSFLAFLALCWLVVSLPALAFIAYRCYGLARGRYVLSRNALVVEWGWRRELIPMATIGAVRAITEPAAMAALRPHGVNWPGCLVGQAHLPEGGPVEFLATTSAQLVVIQYGERRLALSPADPQAFVQAFSDLQAEGPSAVIEPESLAPDFPRWSLWQDQLALGLIAAGAASVVILWGYLLLVYPSLDPTLGLSLNAQGQFDRTGAPLNLFLLPLIAGATWAVNTLLGLLLRRRTAERPMAYLLFGATLFAQGLAWAAAVGLVAASH
jgi:hypothetical protein